jgi:sugar phosphate isomerase/epimerase
MKRRDFIKSAGALSTVMLAGNGLAATTGGGKLKSLKSYGIITGNTGGDWLKENPKEGLKLIADKGYTELEFGGDFGLGFDYAKKYIKDLGLKPLFGGSSMYGIAIDKEAFKTSIAETKSWGKKYFVCYYPFLDGTQVVPLDQWKQIAEWCNEAGKVCKEEGLTFLYHNHNYEFHITDGVIPYDLVLQHTDPEYVNMEMDLYWVAKGDACPITYMKKYPGRFPALHVKDMDYTDERGFADVGSGRLDFPEIFSYSKIAGVKHYIVEHDRPKNGKDSITASGNYLRNLKYREL